MFAKLFGTDTDQVLVLLEEKDNDVVLRLITEPDDLGVRVEAALGFGKSDNQKAWDKADKCLNEIQEHTVRSLLEKPISLARGAGLRCENPDESDQG